MSVARSVVISYFAIHEPELVRQRQANRLRRRRFWAAGVNDIFAVDQHDKWLKYGLGLHTGIEPFSGRIMWIRVWHSNRNPQLILSYYLDTLETLGHMPMVTQSDPGSENSELPMPIPCSANGMILPYGKNVMPEIRGSQLRRRFTPGFEALLDHGVLSGWMLFRWVFIPWLQRELDAYQDRLNNTAKRRDRNKVLPHGVPNLIYHSAADFGALDFKIKVEHKALDHVRNLYIKPSHVVFDLVPLPFGDCVQRCYDELGCPLVTRRTVWEVYLRLLGMLQVHDGIPDHIDQLDDIEDLGTLPLLEDHDELPYREETNGTYYMGGVGGGLGLGIEHLNQLEGLAHDDEPEITLSVDENIGLDHAGLVVWEFSDGSDSDDASDTPDDW
ncbi:hypothetical protein DFH29DRAFT_947187 [Suillus ampliporus]|nr:hypothetical protein DFH29DRAFT_947187 [Suillus ampliporus]